MLELHPGDWDLALYIQPYERRVYMRTLTHNLQQQRTKFMLILLNGQEAA